jgi:hypothetical protein
MNYKHTTETFIEKCNLLFPDNFDFSKSIYTTYNNDITVTCIIHGNDIIRPAGQFMRGRGCPHCGLLRRNDKLRLGLDRFIEKSNIVHNYKYDYSLSDYVNTETKIEIICPIHGSWKSKAGSHMAGNGCAKCVNHSENSIGFSRHRFISKCKNNQASLYIIGMSKKDESFIKIGITTQSLKQRFNNKRGHKVFRFMEIINLSGSIWDLEKYLHECLLPYKYIPKTKFDGYTECFNFKAMMDIQKLLLDNPIIKINESLPN